MEIHSTARPVNIFAQNVSNDSIKNEPMFFNCDLDFAIKNGGPITHAFINALPLDWKNSELVFDSRIHMLMKEWYPCIPGWHLNDVPRSGPNNQPNITKPEYESEHILALVNADVAPTAFIEGRINIDPNFYIKEGINFYNYLSDHVDNLIREQEILPWYAKDRILYEFNWKTIHTGVEARGNGWRWFGRVSRNTNRTKNITNEIRANAQVYLEAINKGW